ncbi:Vms1/Ankzf1 family peptidyl-tRNA hydrolase [Streptomyces sp. NPDC059506]|uniref:baeRF2 domain-containing protein n=1 Tax=Streptomyces TaxID=1883 RepID=UPI00369900E1
MELGFLSPLFQQPGPWASVYLPPATATEDAAKQHELTVRSVCDDLAARGADRDTCEALRQRLAGARADRAPGVAAFAAGGRVVLDLPLPTAPGRPSAHWAALPHTSPLLELMDDTPPCLIALVDRTGADFRLDAGTGSRPAGSVEGEDWPVHRTASASWSERHFQNSVENTWEQNAAGIARALHEAFTDSGAGAVVLAGDPRERREVYDKLPEEVRAVTVETEHGGRAPGSGTPRLDEEVERTRHRLRGRRTEEILDRYRTGLGLHGEQAAAVSGVPALVEAAQSHRIAALLISPHGSDLEREVWVGPDPDQLSTRRSDLQYLGETSPSPAPAGDALLRSAAVTGAEVLTVPEVREAPEGGLGALLRGTAPVSAQAR